MQIKMRPIGIDRRPLKSEADALGNPPFASLANRDARAVGGVNAGPYLVLDAGIETIGALLAGKSLEAALPALIDVVNRPGFLFMALSVLPFALADRHETHLLSRLTFDYAEENPEKKPLQNISMGDSDSSGRLFLKIFRYPRPVVFLLDAIQQIAAAWPSYRAMMAFRLEPSLHLPAGSWMRQPLPAQGSPRAPPGALHASPIFQGRKCRQIPFTRGLACGGATATAILPGAGHAPQIFAMKFERGRCRLVLLLFALWAGKGFLSVVRCRVSWGRGRGWPGPMVILRRWCETS
ncbi:hypothetical protein [Bradyrhizobium sp. 930_D9_N1_4]|uniref:hypothetical protein n=1 Tax=Bradyrhizobium sp. 930_D9_N1_4 TaxID=3240374 RepID=UPI003F8BA0B3